MAKTKHQPNLFNPAIAEGVLRDYCTQAKLTWNQGNWDYIVPIIVKAGLTHGQAIEAVKAHITLVAHLFNPTAYSWKGRLILAAHFVFNFKRR